MNSLCNCCNIKTNKTIYISRHIFYNPWNTSSFTKDSKNNIMKVIL